MYEDYLKHVSLEISEKIEKFVKEEVFGNSEYLFINKVDGINQGYCTKCNNEYQVADIKHNEYGICPHCEASLRAKLTRYGRGNCINEACFYYFEKSIIDPNVVTCKGYFVTKDYSLSYQEPQIAYNLNAIYIFEENEGTMLKQNYWDNGWNKKSSVFDFNQGYLSTKACYCSFESIEKSIKDTKFQYLPYKKFQGHYSMIKLFEEYLKHPCIEYLVKEGFENLVADKLNGRLTYSTVNWNGKTIFKILKLSKNELKEIKDKNVKITFEFLKVYKDAKKQNWGLNTEEIVKVTSEYQGCYDSLKSMLEYSSMRKLLKYFNKQYVEYNIYEKEKHYPKESSALITFRDYMRDCIKLEMDTTKDQVIFPKNLYTAHQNAIKQIKMQKDERIDLLIKDRIKLLEKYIFECNGLTIRPAKSSSELIKEGAALTHCVGGYADRYAKGETNILLIRKASEPEIPYYTMEVIDNKIIQVRGKNNRSADIYVDEIVKVFTKEKLNKKTKKNRIKISA
jgi:hypothetical protein